MWNSNVSVSIVLSSLSINVAKRSQRRKSSSQQQHTKNIARIHTQTVTFFRSLCEKSGYFSFHTDKFSETKIRSSYNGDFENKTNGRKKENLVQVKSFSECVCVWVNSQSDWVSFREMFVFRIVKQTRMGMKCKKNFVE